jgi:hypothetical protein
MPKILRDPFFHFLVLGVLLFAGHSLWAAKISKAERTIYVSENEMQRQALIFAGENRRTANEDDLKALLYAHVEEEALVREAEARGLGERDTIIRRRLAQKMRFLIEDVSPPKLPDEAELRAWFDARAVDFAAPPRLSFTHIYFSPDKGDPAARAAQAAAGLSPNDDGAALGDPFIMRRDYQDVTPIDIARLFGADFARQLKEKPIGEWGEAIESAFGVHLVKLSKNAPAVPADYENVREQVQTAWIDSRQREANAQRLQDIVSKYTVKVAGE